jgi:glyoxylase-like metal-dependent hydrolase (beta-lactamase superfamily II)
MMMTKTQGSEQIKTKELRIGPYTLHPVPTGEFGLDGGSMFGTVPKVLWEKSNPPDEKNRIAMEARALLLQSPERNILIDTGNGSDFVDKYGEKLGTKFAEMYAVDEKGPSLLSSLKKHGVNPEDITDVVLTHLHFDHAGGATRALDSKIVPTFPRARYYVQKSNYETAKSPNVREKASYFAANFQPLIDAGVLTFTEGDQKNLLPNISLIVSNGHTQGHQVVQIADDHTQLFYCGDVIPTSSHIRSAWIMGYDLNPLVIIDEKNKLLNKSSEKESYFYFEHDPYCDMATVEKINEEFKVKERFLLK